ncbi:MAG: hypothetical protein JRH11_23980 [Deltaproteobacteria bacterium]|nr:hypothetical protein [Deltaproteobacteria bacterium]
MVLGRSRFLIAAGCAATLVASGCSSLAKQLPPTDFAALNVEADRETREAEFAAHSITRHPRPQGMRYTKGTDPNATQRSWHSLDKVLRSEQLASQALPAKQLRIARVFTGLTVVAGIGTTVGMVATAQQGLDLNNLGGQGAFLITSAALTVAFAVIAGVSYGRARRGYEKSVELYNDSLGMRLGLNEADGSFVPPKGALVDAEGFVLEEPAPQPIPVEPPPEPEPASPQPQAPVIPPDPEAAPVPVQSPKLTPKAPDVAPPEGLVLSLFPR